MTVGAVPPGLVFDAREEPGQVTLVLVGEVDATSEEALWSAVRGDLGEPGRRVVLDCEAVTYLDSTGLRLVAKARRVGDLVVAHPRPSIRRIPDIAGLSDVVIS